MKHPLAQNYRKHQGQKHSQVRRTSRKTTRQKEEKRALLSKMLNTLIIAIQIIMQDGSVHGVNTLTAILIFSLLQEPQIVMATKQKNRSQY